MQVCAEQGTVWYSFLLLFSYLLYTLYTATTLLHVYAIDILALQLELEVHHDH